MTFGLYYIVHNLWCTIYFSYNNYHIISMVHFSWFLFNSHGTEVKTDMSYVILVPKKFDSKNAISGRFRFISVKFPDFFFEPFDSTKRFVFEFQGESIELFLSNRAHFRRYQHFRVIWQSTASSSSGC